jgi:NMD protein affecting ribosome stability and mRNA decay
MEEKGQRTPRSTDVYKPKGGLKEESYCTKCGAVYRSKRWVLDADELQRLKGTTGVGKVVCPGCLRIKDNNPAGIVTAKGKYFLQHEEEVLNLIKHIEAKSRQKNPLGRIMEISQEKDLLTIATTEEKLAQKLGRELFKAHGGELAYQWSHDQNFVRVNWKR